MPYRRLPKTDASRLKALEALTDNNEVYTVEGRFISRELLIEAQRLYAVFSDTCEQYKSCMRTQVRYSKRMGGLHHNAMTYISHFLQVLFLAIERGEVNERHLELYGIDKKCRVVPYLKTADAVMAWGAKVIEGEKARLKKGGKPMLSPPIGAVITHFDVFKNMFLAQKQYQARSAKALTDITILRPKVDKIILELWNQIEHHFENEPPERKFDLCRKFGVVYYYRRHEKRE